MSRNDDETDFMKSFKGMLWMLGLIGFAILVLCLLNLHRNDVQNIQVVQSIDGDVDIRRDGGWYVMFNPEIWTYPKASVEICCIAEKDAIDMQFSNKSTAKLNCQIGYRIDSADDETFLKLHQQVEGDDEKIWLKVVSTLQTITQCIASQYTPSESVEKFAEFAQRIRDGILHEKSLLAEGIDVVSFSCAGLPEYDDDTKKQFAKQKEADLAKRLAEAEKLRLESEKTKVEANYAMQIAEQKGQAEAQMAKDVQSAERDKKLAEIAAQKQVAVQELEKQEMLIKAAKEKEVAEIEAEKQKLFARIEAEKELAVAEVAKRTEAENLERVKLEAAQKVAQAEAKKQSIALAGEITEAERVRLQIEKETRIGVAAAYAHGIGQMRLPVVMTTGGASGGEIPQEGLSAAMKTFFDVKNAAAALELLEHDDTTVLPQQPQQ